MNTFASVPVTRTDDLLAKFHHYWCEDLRMGKDFALRDTMVSHQFRDFGTHCVQNYERGQWKGHFTGSALVVNPTLTRVLLTHHRKLGMWLQLGGHADGDTDLARVAMTEALEESGLTNLTFFGFPSLQEVVPFDLDIHSIPESPYAPQHVHYDMRFLVVADDSQSLTISDESHDLRWFQFDEARVVNQEDSMVRQYQKVALLKAWAGV